jgi:hypothetical protein
MKRLVAVVVDTTPNKTQYFKVSLFPMLDDNLSWAPILSMSSCDTLVVLYTVNRLHINNIQYILFYLFLTSKFIDFKST